MSAIKHIKKIYIISQKADTAPPLGTVLGNIGVNTSSFCTQFNAYTKNLPTYFKVSVYINIFENRNFEFFVTPPPIGWILYLLQFPVTIKVVVDNREQDKTIYCIKLYDVLKLAKFKFGVCDKRTVMIIVSVIKSKNLTIVRKK